MKIIVIFLVLLSGLLQAAEPTTEATKVTLQLKWKHQFQSAGFIAAYEKGFYKDVGIDIELLEHQNDTQIIADLDALSNIIQSKYNTLNKSKKALIFEGQTLKALSGYRKNFGHLDLGKIKAIAQLFSFMIKGQYTINALDNFIYDQQQSTISLTKQEKEFIKNNPKITMVAPIFFPHSFLSKDGELQGIDIDYFNLIAKNWGFNLIISLQKKNTYLENFIHKQKVEKSSQQCGPTLCYPMVRLSI